MTYVDTYSVLVAVTQPKTKLLPLKLNKYEWTGRPLVRTFSYVSSTCGELLIQNGITIQNIK